MGLSAQGSRPNGYICRGHGVVLCVPTDILTMARLSGLSRVYPASVPGRVSVVIGKTRMLLPGAMWQHQPSLTRRLSSVDNKIRLVMYGETALLIETIH